MKYAVLFLCLILLSVATDAKIYGRCELARELKNFDLPDEEIPTWVCIVEHESRYDTAAMNLGSGDHGLFQISQMYWCSPPGDGFGCNKPCSAFRDDDIADDLQCIRRIYNEHKRISQDGFNAWVVYPLYCKGDNSKYVKDCFDGFGDNTLNFTESANPSEEPVDEDDDGYVFPPLPVIPHAAIQKYSDDVNEEVSVSKKLKLNGNIDNRNALNSYKDHDEMLHINDERKEQEETNTIKEKPNVALLSDTISTKNLSSIFTTEKPHSAILSTAAMFITKTSFFKQFTTEKPLPQSSLTTVSPVIISSKAVVPALLSSTPEERQTVPPSSSPLLKQVTFSTRRPLPSFLQTLPPAPPRLPALHPISTAKPIFARPNNHSQFTSKTPPILSQLSTARPFVSLKPLSSTKPKRPLLTLPKDNSLTKLESRSFGEVTTSTQKTPVSTIFTFKPFRFNKNLDKVARNIEINLGDNYVYYRKGNGFRLFRRL